MRGAAGGPKHGTVLLAILACEVLAVGALFGQAPSGTIAGVVTDNTGAVLPRVQVIVTQRETGAKRVLLTSAAGAYSAPALPAGIYEVDATALGFKRVVREAPAEAGRTTEVDFTMEIGVAADSITVEGTSPQISYDAHDLGGIVSRSQIESLPLNGRGFLELAKLEPGGQQATRTTDNRTLVPLLGAPVGQNGRGTRVTIDGGSVMEVGNGGAAMGFSQEVVQEFQVSSVNFDLSTGITAGAAVNIVTRSGGNQFHGSGFFFFRDHHLSAYPGLNRAPLNPDPFFQRRQFGVAGGGPIRKNRAFFFATFERNEQRGVGTNDIATPDFASLSRITPSPTYVDQASVRADARLSDRHTAFLRYSHEDYFAYAFSSLTNAGARGYPSAWTRQPAWADQSILGVTSQLGANIVNDLRFSYFFVSSAEQAPSAGDCPGCLGMGAPAIRVSPDLFIGVSTTTAVLGRRYHLNDIATWQKGRHRLRLGGDWETARGGRTDLGNEPVTMNLFSPQTVRQYNALPLTPPDRHIPLPISFSTLADVLQLPVQNFTVGIGDPHVPQAGFGDARTSPLVHLFLEDTWRMRPRLTLNYGLGWNYDMPFNADLRKPDYLAPLLGARGLDATHRNWKEFSPSVGFAWSPREDSKTMVRGGAGIYYEFRVPYGTADPERVSLGPLGTGRGTYASGGISNPLTDIPGVPAGAFLNFSVPTLFTGAALMEALPAIRASLEQSRGDPNNRDFSVTNIEMDKQGVVIDPHLPSSSATHASIGVQREIAHDFVVSADFVWRHFSHLAVPPQPLGPIDLNHFYAARGPLLQICSTAQRIDPNALCSLGSISLGTAIGHARYEGLLVRAEKRLSRRWQFLGSYAYSSNVGNSFSNGFNNDDWLANFGPLDRDVRHILNLSGLVQLPRRFELGFTMIVNSKPPFSAYLGTLDLNGDGTTGDLLPGAKVNQFNRGLNKEDLRRLVADFNTKYAGKKDAKGRTIPTISLPSNFELGDRFITQDVRLSRVLQLSEHWRLTVMAEAFNLFNIANLSGRSGDLLSASFGQATSRVTQVFGSGGPRSFQLAARVSF